MAARPGDWWPRGTGHVLLSVPGLPEEKKAYHEPGGGFSPAVGSFGFAVWVLDENGNVRATGDSLPLDQARQRLVWPDNKPTVHTETPFYQAVWSAPGAGHATLRLMTKAAGSVARLVLALRGVGPAGGPVKTLDWNGKRLRVNDRWTVTLDPAPAHVYLADEDAQMDWKTVRSDRKRLTSATGWACARIVLEGFGGLQTLTITEDALVPKTPLPNENGRSGLTLDLPDARFAESLDAQVAHLLMGLVGNETRPGEPTNYPINWLRDGAYTIVALARAGHVETAKQLARPFAEHDFFGGFGAEADGPGLALWAVGEAATLARDPSFDIYLWPHVQRKASLIGEMMDARAPLRRPFAGPVVPQHAGRADLDLICQPARNGLVWGRMDHHYPVLFVNAVSYRGLVEAATLADRLGHAAEAVAWRGRAAALRAAWAEGFNTPEAGNERTFVSGVWPTGVVLPENDPAYLAGLEKRWNDVHDTAGNLKQTPLWTYFNVAEAHQFLLLGRPERVWQTLSWFWEHQASPGLFTWWEGSGEENNFGRWEHVRGWVAPAHVTPHYWTAGEMLLLQLDMLACRDERAAAPTLLVGAGVKADWLARPLRVRGVGTSLGVVDWSGENGAVHVVLHGSRDNKRAPHVRLGPAFAKETRVTIEVRG